MLSPCHSTGNVYSLALCLSVHVLSRIRRKFHGRFPGKQRHESMRTSEYNTNNIKLKTLSSYFFDHVVISLIRSGGFSLMYQMEKKNRERERRESAG